MTREELRGIVEGISDEQLKKILDINSADIGKAKKNTEDMKEELATAKETVESLTSEVSALKEGMSDADEMKKKIEELQNIIDTRQAEDLEAEKAAELKKRFEKASGGAEFLNEFTRNGVMERFSEALEIEDNCGKSDAEIFEAVTADMGNLFATDGGVPSVVASTSGFGADLSSGDIREIMGLSR